MIGIERQVGAPGLEDSEQGHDHVGRAIHAQADHLLRTDAEALKLVRKLVRAAVKVAIRHAIGATNEGRAIGSARNVNLTDGGAACFMSSLPRMKRS
jgi:hypothetical protein